MGLETRSRLACGIGDEDIAALTRLASASAPSAVVRIAGEIAALRSENREIEAENEWLEGRIAEEAERAHG